MEERSLRDTCMDALIPISLILGFVLLLTLSDGEGETTVFEGPLESWIETVVGYVTSTGEMVAALVVGIAIVRCIVSYIRLLVLGTHRCLDSVELIRLRLGRVLTLGLELTVASDILRTAVAPTRQDIVNLGAIVLLRTLLNYFLEQEIRQGEARNERCEIQNQGG